MRGDLKLKGIAAALILIAEGTHQLYHWINSKSQLYDPTTEQFEFNSSNPKMLFTSKFKQDANYVPTPYNIFAIDLKTGKTIRLTYGEIFDFSPSYSQFLNCIFFTANRDSIGQEVSYQYDGGSFMKINLNSMEIESARPVLNFLNINNKTQIVSPRVSPYNDSLLAFCTKSDNPKFYICNYISQKKIISIPIVDIYKYRFARKYLIIQQSRVSDSLRFIKVDLETKTYEPYKMIVSRLDNIDVTGEFVYNMSSNSSDSSKILYTKINIETSEIDTLENVNEFDQSFLEHGSFWHYPKYILNDSDKILSDTLHKLWLYKNSKVIKLFDRIGVNDDYYIWYDKK